MSATYYSEENVGWLESACAVGSVKDAFDRVYLYLLQDQPCAFFAERLNRELDELFFESQQETWNQSIHLPIHQATRTQAHKFIESLPIDLKAPEISVDPDGEVSFEWYRGPRRRFSVSVGPNNEVAFAGLFGPRDEIHGVKAFYGQVPAIVIELARRVG